MNEVLKFQNLLSALPVRVRNFRSKKSIGIRRSYQYQTPCNFFWSATNPRGTDFLVWFTDCGLDLQLGITPMHAIRTLLWYHEVVVHIIFYLGYDFLNPESKLSDSNLRIYRLQVVSLQIAPVNLTTWILDNKKSITVPDFFCRAYNIMLRCRDMILMAVLHQNTCVDWFSSIFRAIFCAESGKTVYGEIKKIFSKLSFSNIIKMRSLWETCPTPTEEGCALICNFPFAICKLTDCNL